MNTEAGLHRYRDAERWPPEEALAAMLDNQAMALFAVRLVIPALAQAAAAAALRLEASGGRLIYCGAGASGRLAVQDGVELFPTFGWPLERLAYLMAGGAGALVRSVEGAEDDAVAGTREMAALEPGPDDVVLCVAASGTTRYTIAVQAEGRRRGALTVALANNAEAPLLTAAEHPILLETGAEFLPGSTRMAAGTAQKIALNLFSTHLMSLMGRIYRGLMVDVVPTNDKLVVRAHRIVAAIAGVSEETAREAWGAAGRNIKIAVLLLDGLDRPAAERALAAAGGRLDRVR